MLGDDRVVFELEPEGEPLRLALDWRRRSDEQLRRARRAPRHPFDQAGRAVQLGADRRYTGPDCPPELLAGGGIPQGDYAPVPWLISSRGYGVWVRGGCERDPVRPRRASGSRCRPASRWPLLLAVALLCSPTPAARLRALLSPDRLPGAAARVGLRVLEEPRRLRAPGRRARRLRGLSPPPTSRSTRSCSTRLGRRSTTPGSSTRTSSRTRAELISAHACATACGRSCG